MACLPLLPLGSDGVHKFPPRRTRPEACRIPQESEAVNDDILTMPITTAYFFLEKLNPTPNRIITTSTRAPIAR